MRSFPPIVLALVFILLAIGCFTSHSIDDNDPRETNTVCASDCPELEWVRITGGTFSLGNVNDIGIDDEQPLHEVTVHSFLILKTEVTVSQYAKCVDAGVCSIPDRDSEWHTWNKPGQGNHPVNGVNRNQTKEFGEWVGARLPSEAEWEYAARGGDRDTLYPWGNEKATCDHVVLSSCGIKGTLDVCSRPLGNTVQGLCDMVGNVWEWVEDDFHEDHENLPSDGRARIDNPRSDLGVIRDGSWRCPADCNPDIRSSYYIDDRATFIGFRLVKDL